MTLLNNWSVIFGLIILAITLFVQLLKTRKTKNTQPENIKKEKAINFEENKTSKSPAEILTDEFEEAYKRTGDPGLGIILAFRQKDAEIEKLRSENSQNKGGK